MGNICLDFDREPSFGRQLGFCKGLVLKVDRCDKWKGSVSFEYMPILEYKHVCLGLAITIAQMPQAFIQQGRLVLSS